MAVITTNNATLELTSSVNGNHLFTSFISGDVYEIAPVNDRTSHINSSNGGVSLQKREDGGVHTLTLRVQKGSDDDIFLNSNLNVDGVAIFNGSSKENIIKDGVQLVETWALENGTITSSPTGTKNDQDGNALCEYVLTFRNAERRL